MISHWIKDLSAWWSPPHEWQPDRGLGRRYAVDGTLIDGPAMRRKIKGEWQYRPMTAGEEDSDMVGRHA